MHPRRAYAEAQGRIRSPLEGEASQSHSTRERHLLAVMDRENAIARLREHEAELKQLGVQHLYLLGSTVRGDGRHDSAYDLFIDYDRDKFNLYHLMDVRERATDILGSKADVTTRDSLHKLLRLKIEASAWRIF
jgi:uncharacterized protein